MKKVLYTKYNSTRNPKFQTSTRIVSEDGTKYVEKAALTEEAKAYVRDYERKYLLNQNIYQKIIPLQGEWGDKCVKFPFIEGNSAKKLLENEKNSIDKLCNAIEKCLVDVFAYKKDVICEFESTDKFVEVFGNAVNVDGKAVKCADIDIIFDNIILCNDRWYSIDYEWTFDFPIPVDFIKYRMLYRYYYSEKAYFDGKLSEEEFLRRFGLNNVQCRQYARWELGFQYYVYGDGCKYVYPARYVKKNVDFKKLIDKYGDLEKALTERDEKELTMQHEINLKTNELIYYKNNYQAIINSMSWKLTQPLRKLLNFPACIREHGWKYTLQYILKGAGDMPTKRISKMPVFKYNEQLLEEERKAIFLEKLTFSILVPLFNTPENFLREMVESVQKQTYADWELCLADGSDEEHGYVETICLEYQKNDERIKYRKLKSNGGISRNTNVCIEMATGDYIVLFDHDDLLHASALYACRKVIDEQDADYIYTDEMTFVNQVNNVTYVHYKPDYSPDTLRSYNYICHLSVFRKSLLEQVGGFCEEYDGSQDYDLILRLTENAKNIVHIPEVLYFWRAHENSVAQDVSAKPYTLSAARKALAAHLERVGLEGNVMDGRIPSVYRIEYQIQGNPKISILIPNKDHIDELKVCLKSIIQKSTYKNYEIVIVENNSTEDTTFQYYKELEEKYDNVKVVYWKGEFNFSAINNYGFTYTIGEYLLLLNNDVEVISANWLEEMLMFAQRQEVGAVGAMLYYPDDTVQHAGVILGIGGIAGHSHKYYNRDEYGYASRMVVAQNLSAVTAACMLMRRDIYEELQGLDENYKVAFNDIDFCMRIREKGYLIVFTPFAELYHYESKSRGLEDTEEKKLRFQGEVERFMAQWGTVLERGDPYYNPHLSLICEDFSFKE